MTPDELEAFRRLVVAGRDLIAARIAEGRPLSPEEIAAARAFFAVVDAVRVDLDAAIDGPAAAIRRVFGPMNPTPKEA